MPAEPARFVLTLSCGDRRGIVAAVANSIASQDCNIVESAQYGDPDSGRFFMRVSFAAPQSVTRESFERGFRPVATGYDFDWQLHDLAVKPRVMILVSKMGHCLNDLLYRNSIGQLPMELVSVVSNHETDAPARRGRGAALPLSAVEPAGKEEQEAALLGLDRGGARSISWCSRATCRCSRTTLRAACRAGDQHPPFLPAELQGRQALSPRT